MLENTPGKTTIENNLPIKVKLRQEFSISPPNLRAVIGVHDESETIDMFPFEIEGLGVGSITVEQFSVATHNFTPYREVSGPIEPIGFQIEIRDLNKVQLATTRCTLSYDGKTFQGFPVYDQGELQREGKAVLSFNYFIEEGQEIIPLFQRDPEIIKQVKFAFTTQQSSYPFCLS